MLLLPSMAISANDAAYTFENTLALDITAVYISPTYAKDNMVFVISDNQLYRSQDGGKSWEKIDLYIDNVHYYREQYIYSLLCEGNGIVLLSGYSIDKQQNDDRRDFLIISWDGGNLWHQIYDNSFYNLLSAGGALFGTNDNKQYLMKSTTHGSNWNWELFSSMRLCNYAFATTDGQSLWAIVDNKLWFSNKGIFWEKYSNVNYNNSRIFSYGDSANKVLVICNPDRLMDATISTDNGATWQKIDFKSVPEINPAIYYADITKDGFIVFSTSDNRILISNNYGKTWKVVSEGLTTHASHIKCAVQGESLIVFAGTAKGLFRLQYPLRVESTDTSISDGTKESSTIRFTNGNKHYTVDNQSFAMDVAPFVIDNRTFVPVKYLGEGLDAEVIWDETKNSIIIKKNNTVIELSIYNPTIVINGVPTIMNVNPIIRDNRIFLPPQYIAEPLDYSVQWDQDSKNIRIFK